MQWDAIAQYYPWRVFYARSIRSGHIPLWNPHQFGGTPFLANGQSAVLYPLNLVYVVMDPITATTVYAALHLFLALAFTYMLLIELGRSKAAAIVGAVTFAFSAFVVLWLELPTFIGAAVWLPLALLLIQRAVDRRSTFHGMLAGVALAMAFLAGHFQIAFYVVLAAMLWWLWKLVEDLRAEGQVYATLRVVVPFLGCIAMLALIAAPQALPTVELARESHRVREVSPEGYSRFIANALKPYRLITAFVPRFFGDPSQNNYYLLGNLDGHMGSAADYMEYGMYAGILPLMLAILGIGSVRRFRHTGFFVFLAVMALLVACGTIINWLFYYAIPGFSALGGPNRMLVLYVFGVAALAAFGFDVFTQRPTEPSNWPPAYRANRTGRRLPVGAAQGAVAFAIVVIIAGALAFRYTMISRTLICHIQPLDRISGSAFQLFMWCALVPACLMMLRGWNILQRRTFAVLAVLMVVADLFAFGINYNPTCERSKVYPKTELTTRLKQIAGDERIAPINPEWSLFETPKAILPPNAAMVYGLYDVQGYDSLYTRAYKHDLDLIQGQDSSPIENGNMVLVKNVTPQLSNVATFFLTQEKLDTEPWFSLVDHVDGVYIYRLSGGHRAGSHHYEPFTFRLGLYLALLGVTALAFVGTFRFVRFKHPAK
jgi:hypothetical protein